ncbi:CRISPR-associated protein Cas4 [Thermoanaerobacterium sp. RBIITD]|uniref:CRISPR-associated protein Cas4 n=1 Tax=Thermoanaerobacterium sp. RBIITD TaxID=1550240 RepID=UPI000BB88244|nr:CRISPR-associated protein Cas4 [Thermoanaerobacterium sp. RBIITD]SNX53626.1 CRISPR-associated exonuclease Cas4 [Thermoanaerobacterium sp. RBIITD]
MDVEVTGSLMQSYSICKRQVWLMAHQIIPDQEHPYIEMGRIIDDISYDRDRKKLNFENVVIDLVRNDKDNLLIGEVKKSSKAEKSARMQLLFYLYKLKKSGIVAKGQLFFPEERKKVDVELTEDYEKEIVKAINEITDIIHKEKAPDFAKIPYCKNCGYREFCLS